MNMIIGNFPLLQGGGGSMATTFLTFGLVFAIFYFLIIRPQNKKQKEAKMMLSALKKSDKVVTIGGIRGVVHSVKEDTVVIKVDDNVKMEFSKSAVAGVLSAARPVEAPRPEKKDAETESAEAAKEE